MGILGDRRETMNGPHDGDYHVYQDYEPDYDRVPCGNCNHLLGDHNWLMTACNEKDCKCPGFVTHEQLAMDEWLDNQCPTTA